MKAKLVVLFCFVISIGYAQNRYAGLPSWTKQLSGDEFDGDIRSATVTNRTVTNLVPYDYKWMDDGTIKRIPKENTQKIARIGFNYFEESENFNFYVDLSQYLNTEINQRITTKWIFDDGSKKVYFGNNFYFKNNTFFFNKIYNDDDEICFYEVLKKIASSNGFSVRIIGKNKNIDLRFSSNNSSSVFNFVIGDDADKDDLLENCSYYDRLKAKTQKNLFKVSQISKPNSSIKFKKKKFTKDVVK